MCIICASKAGVRQPTEAMLRRMFINNPHGAGYMYARDGKVRIEKGFMTWGDFSRAVKHEAFTAADPVVYHFRISTQAGVIPEMTQPFPLTSEIAQTKGLGLVCPAGVAHNGIVRLTSDRTDREYSDTAHYIAEFMAYMIRNVEDMKNPAILSAVERTTNSKWALLDGSGEIVTVGGFIEDGGLLFSNGTYQEVSYYDRGGIVYAHGRQGMIRSFYEDDAYSDDEPEESAGDLEAGDINPETGEPWDF